MTVRGFVSGGVGIIIWFPNGYAAGMLRLMYILHAMGYVTIFAFFFTHLYLPAGLGPGNVHRLG